MTLPIVNIMSAKASNLNVLKFGGSVLRDPQAMHAAAHEVYRFYRRGEKVLAVTSALAGETDALLALSEDIGGDTKAVGAPALIRLGEMRAAALLGLALQRIGLDSRVVDPAEIKLRASGSAYDAHLCDLDHARLNALLSAHDVLIVPGFSGVLSDGQPALLGRGGTDLSAVYLGAELKPKRIRLIKDVDGLYASDPKNNRAAQLHDEISWENAQKVCGCALQNQALHYAKTHNLKLEIAALARKFDTKITSNGMTSLSQTRTRRLKVALLGFGTVGQGVYSHLMRHKNLFDVSGILVRNSNKERCREAPDGLISTDAFEVFAIRPDIVVEMTGTMETANAFILNAFFSGADVVSANKAVMAANFNALNLAANQAGRALRYSAAVGGGVPMLEALSQARDGHGVLALRGVINGTVNFILDRLGENCPLDQAIKEAQQNGFAEANPSADLNGEDAAAKLFLMAKNGFSAPLRLNQISLESLNNLDPALVVAARLKGRVIRQVSEIKRNAKAGLKASVRLIALPEKHFLAATRGEQNRLVIDLKNGQSITLRGKGAGRWPTAEAVMADLLDIHRLRGQYREKVHEHMLESAFA